MATTPEQRARDLIDPLLRQAGWALQDVAAADLAAARGVAIREFPLLPGHGFADYLLYVDGMDIFWLRDDSLADSDNLPPPEVIAQEIVDDLEAALEQFRLIAADLGAPQ